MTDRDRLREDIAAEEGLGTPVGNAVTLTRLGLVPGNSYRIAFTYQTSYLEPIFGRHLMTACGETLEFGTGLFPLGIYGEEILFSHTFTATDNCQIKLGQRGRGHYFIDNIYIKSLDD